MQPNLSDRSTFSYFSVLLAWLSYSLGMACSFFIGEVFFAIVHSRLLGVYPIPSPPALSQSDMNVKPNTVVQQIFSLHYLEHGLKPDWFTSGVAMLDP